MEEVVLETPDGRRVNTLINATHILVADDDPKTLLYVRGVLEDEG